MVNNNLNDDALMKLLCDDMYVTYKTFENTNSHYYSRARQLSQGTQQIYTISTPISTSTTSTPTPNFRTSKIHKFSQNLFENHRTASILIPKPIKIGSLLNENEIDYEIINSNTILNTNLNLNINTFMNENDNIKTYIPKYNTLDELDLYDYHYYDRLNDEIDDSIDLNYRHKLSQFNESPFISPTSLDIMKSISRKTNENENINNNESDSDYDLYSL